MDTLIADNFIFEKTLDKSVPDSDRVVFKQKNLTPFYDNARGGAEYISGKVVIEAFFGNGAEIPDFENALVGFPEVETLEAKANTQVTGLVYPKNFMTAPKNNALVESMRVEQGGTMIVSESQNLAHIVNFMKHCTTSADELKKHGSTQLYEPDSVGPWTATAGLAGVVNNSNNPLSTVSDVNPESYNAGL